MTRRFRNAAAIVLAVIALCGSTSRLAQAKLGQTIEQQVIDADDDCVEAELSRDRDAPSPDRRPLVYDDDDGTTLGGRHSSRA